MLGRSQVSGKYDSPANRESAYEVLSKRTLTKQAAEQVAEHSEAQSPPEKRGVIGDMLWGTGRRQGVVETMAKQTVRTVGSQLGRQIFRGLLGGILGGSRRR